MQAVVGARIETKELYTLLFKLENKEFLKYMERGFTSMEKRYGITFDMLKRYALNKEFPKDFDEDQQYYLADICDDMESSLHYIKSIELYPSGPLLREVPLSEEKTSLEVKDVSFNKMSVFSCEFGCGMAFIIVGETIETSVSMDKFITTLKEKTVRVSKFLEKLLPVSYLEVNGIPEVQVHLDKL